MRYGNRFKANQVCHNYCASKRCSRASGPVSKIRWKWQIDDGSLLCVVRYLPFKFELEEPPKDEEVRADAEDTEDDENAETSKGPQSMVALGILNEESSKGPQSMIAQGLLN